jgi:hypothetical protein
MKIFNKMENILERIKKISINEGISITSLESKIGASKGVLSRAIANSTDIQYKWIQIIVENYPQYSTEWLLTGKGEMLKPDIEKSEVNVDYKEKYYKILEDKDKLRDEIENLKNEIEYLKKGELEETKQPFPAI